MYIDSDNGPAIVAFELADHASYKIDGSVTCPCSCHGMKRAAKIRGIKTEKEQIWKAVDSVWNKTVGCAPCLRKFWLLGQAAADYLNISSKKSEKYSRRKNTEGDFRNHGEETVNCITKV